MRKQRTSPEQEISRGYTQSRPTRYTPPLIVAEIEWLATTQRVTAAEIERTLNADPRFKASASSLRTIQDIVRTARTKDASAPWSIADDDPASSVYPAVVF